jgi:hypothetical protein
MIVTNGTFVVASGILLIVMLVALRHPARLERLHGSPDTLLVVAIVAVYLLSAAPLTVLTTFPAWRYIDTAAVLLPALPLYAALRLAGVFWARPTVQAAAVAV